MKVKLSFLLIGFTFLAGVCFGQNSNVNLGINWGNEINGMRLSISLTNDPITIGSNTILTAQITNSSTSSVKLYIANPLINDFSIYITDDSNNRQTIVQPSGAGYSVSLVEIRSKENRHLLVFFKVGKEIKPGIYLLSAARDFRQAGVLYTLESNAIKVQIR
jgi:hypothetical protein